MRPAGNGRPRVRLIIRVDVGSYHMLRAPEAPGADAMQSTSPPATSGWMWPGAATSGEAGEDHERHHPGLQEQEIGNPRPFAALAKSRR